MKKFFLIILITMPLALNSLYMEEQELIAVKDDNNNLKLKEEYYQLMLSTNSKANPQGLEKMFGDLKRKLKTSKRPLCAADFKSDLSWAICLDNWSAVDRLIAAGAPVDAVHPQEFPPLYYAFFYNRIDYIKLLIQHGANPNPQLPPATKEKGKLFDYYGPNKKYLMKSILNKLGREWEK